MQQEPAHLFGLAVEDLGQPVLGDGPLAAGELGREPPRIGVPSQ